jgi:hypothetical protein
LRLHGEAAERLHGICSERRPQTTAQGGG